jgi:hypothetical protein
MTARQEPKSITFQWPAVPPAPELTNEGRCSDCGVKARFAGGQELAVCPRCFALLWHADWSEEMRQARAEAQAKVAAERAEIKRQRQEAFIAREAKAKLNRLLLKGQLHRLGAEPLSVSAPEIGEGKLGS